MKTYVIHARVDSQIYAELNTLKENLGIKKTTDLISFALHKLFKDNRNEHAKKSPFELMQEAGLIGCIEDSSLDSSRACIKEIFAGQVDEKTKRKP